MKKLNYILLLISLICYGCKKDDSNPLTQSEKPAALPVQSISGQLSNWTHGKSYIAKFESFGTSVIDENGKFNITSLAIPAENQLFSMAVLFDSAAVTPSLSDRNARFYMVDNIILSKAKNSGTIYGIIECINENTAKDDFRTSFIYFDRAVVIDGTAEIKITHGSWTMTQKYIYNKLSYGKGWNKFVMKQGSYDRNTNTVTIEILQAEPSVPVWSYTDPQKIITIQHGTAQAGLKFPLCIDNGYKRSAAIYTSDEVNAKGSIARIAWKALTRTAASRPVKIYLKEVDYNTFNADSLSSVMNGAVQVYTGTVPLLTGQWNWDEFVLMESFVYSGSKNLLVIVETNYGGSGIADDCYFEYSVMNDNKFITWSENDLQKIGTGLPSSSRPNIRLTIDPE